MTTAGQEADRAPKLWLSPPERRFASFVAARQRKVRTPTIVRLEQNYGPAGVRVLSACYLTAIVGQSLMVMGLVLLVLSGHSHGLFIASVLMCGLSVPFLMLGGSGRSVFGAWEEIPSRKALCSSKVSPLSISAVVMPLAYIDVHSHAARSETL
jgi:hypothetical protein